MRIGKEKMKEYEKIKEELYLKQYGTCLICKKMLVGKLDLHHKMRNTEGNRIRYPKLINSIHNLELLHHNCHINRHGEAGKLSDVDAEIIEKKLNG